MNEQQNRSRLSGLWQAVTDPEKQRDRTPIVHRDTDEAWIDMPVPSHWQTAGLTEYQGTLWYKHVFHVGTVQAEKRYFLRFGAVDYLSEAWLNGVFLGVHEGDFDAFEYEVTELLQAGENRLIVKVTSELDANPEQKSIVKGGLYHWDCLPIRQAAIPDFPDVPSSCNPQYPNPVVNPGGIWRDVDLIIRDQAYLTDVQVMPRLTGVPGQSPAVIHVEATVDNRFGVRHWAADAADAASAKGTHSAPELFVKVTVEPHNFEPANSYVTLSIPARQGRSAHSLAVDIPEPALWWSHDLGPQHLYRAVIELRTHDGQIYDTITRVFGIRDVQQAEDWTFYLNGKRLFMRGTNYLSDQFLSQVDRSTYERDVQLMLDAHMNMIRIFAHQEREEFYDLCNEKGILLFQDLPFQWGYKSDAAFIRRAEDVVTRYVRQLQHHPSVALWCVHSESRLYDYNRLDQVLLGLVRTLDPTRPVQRNSVLADYGDLPYQFPDIPTYGAYIPPHLTVHWVGWYWGELKDKEHYSPLFVSEYGTQSVPAKASLAKFIPADALWPPNWDVWRKHGFQTQIYEKNLGPFPDTLDCLIANTQEYQARYYKEHTETLRRKKWQRVKGILCFHFVNCWPAIDWSIIDYYREPKLAYDMIKHVFDPLLLSFKGNVTTQQVTFEPWIVNDYHHSYEGLQLTFEVLTLDGTVLHQASIADVHVNADAAGSYGEIVLDLPAGVTEVLVEGRLLDRDGQLLRRNDALLYPLSPPEGIETAADAKVGL